MIRVAFGQFKVVTPDDLAYTAQLGGSGILINGPDFDTPQWRQSLGNFYVQRSAPSDEWHLIDLINLKAMVERYGLRLEAIENVPLRFYDKALWGQPGRDEQIEHYQECIRNMGRAGIPILGYHWMPNSVWRTTCRQYGRGGAEVSAWDADKFVDSPATGSIRLTADEMWANYKYFMDAVLPVAEEAGVVMALHPDDPPTESLGGVARIMRNMEGFDRALEIGDSDYHQLDFCVGSWSELDPAVMFEALESYGRRRKIAYVHMRTVKGKLPSFSEAFIDEGDVEVSKVIDVLLATGFDGFIIDDHVPTIVGDTDWGHRSRAFATGFIKGVLQARSSA